MKLILAPLSPHSSDLPYFIALNEEAFPPSERMTFDEMFSFASVANLDILSIYDGDSPVGFNGFQETGRFTRLGEDYFEVVCHPAPLCEDSFQDLLKVIHNYVPVFSDQLFSK